MYIQDPFNYLFQELTSLKEQNRQILECLKETGSMEKPDEYLGMEEASRLLKMPVSSIRYHKKCSGLPFHKPGKKLLFKKIEILKWVETFSSQQCAPKEGSLLERALMNRKRYKKK